MRKPIKAIAVFGLVAFLALWLAARNYGRLFHPTATDVNLSFAWYSFRVQDELTRKPVPGVEVIMECLGGTPHAGTVYHTDTEGGVRVYYYDRAQMLPVKVSKPGYDTAILLVWTNSLVADLKRTR